MKIFDNIMARFGFVRKKGLVDTNPATFHLAKLNINAHGLKSPYRQHAWVYACVRAIASNIAGLPLKLYRGDPDDPRQVTSGKLWEILNRPNGNWTRSLFIEAIVSYLQLGGNAVILMDRDRVNQDPRSYWVFPKDRFKPETQGEDLLYLKFQQKSGNIVKVYPEQFMICRLFNPDNIFWGMGPLEAALESVTQDYLASQFNRAFFENGANPGGAVVFKQGLTGPQRNEYNEMLRNRHEGPDKAFKTMILEGDVDYKQYAIKHTDMCFEALKKFSRDDVCGVFKVPKSEISVYEDINYATARSADKSFWQKTLIPICKLIESTWEAQFFIPYNKGLRDRYWIKFDLSVVEALQEDYQEKVDTGKKLFDMGVPFNQINEKLELGFEPIESGEQGYLPIGLVPAGSDPFDKAIEGSAEEKLYLPRAPIIDVYDRAHTEEQERIWKLFVRILNPAERRYFNEMRRYMARAKKWLLGQINKYNEAQDIVIDDLMLSPSWDTELKVGASKHYKQVASVYGPIIESNLAKLGIDFTFNAADPLLVDYLKGKVNKIVGINDRMRNMVRDKVTAGVEANNTVQEIAGSVADAMADTKARGLRIARTETTSAANGISFKCHQQAGIKKHMWVAALDEVTRTSHLEAMALGGIPIGQVFGPTGCRYPGDENADPGEIINCRCDLIPTE